MANTQSYQQITYAYRKPLTTIADTVSNQFSSTPTDAFVMKIQAVNAQPEAETIEALLTLLQTTKSFEWNELYVQPRNTLTFWRAGEIKAPKGNSKTARKVDYHALQYLAEQWHAKGHLSWNAKNAIIQHCQNKIHPKAYQLTKHYFANLGPQGKQRFSGLLQNMQFDQALSWLKKGIDLMNPGQLSSYFPPNREAQFYLLQHLVNENKALFQDLWGQDHLGGLEETYLALAEEETPKAPPPPQEEETSGPSQKKTQRFSLIRFQKAQQKVSQEVTKFWQGKKKPTDPSSSPASPREEETSRGEEEEEHAAEDDFFTPQVRTQSSDDLMTVMLDRELKLARDFDDAYFTAESRRDWRSFFSKSAAVLSVGGAVIYFGGLFSFSLLTFTLAGIEMPIVLIPLIVVGALITLAAGVSLYSAFFDPDKTSALQALLKATKFDSFMINRDAAPLKEPVSAVLEWGPEQENTLGLIDKGLNEHFTPEDRLTLRTLLLNEHFTDIDLKKKPSEQQKGTHAIAFLHSKLKTHFGKSVELQSKPLAEQYQYLLMLVQHLQDHFKLGDDLDCDVFDITIRREGDLQGKSVFSQLKQTLRTHILLAQKIDFQNNVRNDYKQSGGLWLGTTGLAAATAVATPFAFPLLIGLIGTVALGAVAIYSGVKVARSFTGHREAKRAIEKPDGYRDQLKTHTPPQFKDPSRGATQMACEQPYLAFAMPPALDNVELTFEHGQVHYTKSFSAMDDFDQGKSAPPQAENEVDSEGEGEGEEKDNENTFEYSEESPLLD